MVNHNEILLNLTRNSNSYLVLLFLSYPLQTHATLSSYSPPMILTLLLMYPHSINIILSYHEIHLYPSIYDHPEANSNPPTYDYPSPTTHPSTYIP